MIARKFLFSFFIFSFTSLVTSAASKNTKSTKVIASDETSKESPEAVGQDIDKGIQTPVSPEELLRKIEVENALYRAQLEKKLAKEFSEAKLEIERLKMEKERMLLKNELENEILRKKHLDEIRSLKDQKEKLQIELEIMQSKIAKEIEVFNAETLSYQKALYKMRIEMDMMQNTLIKKYLKNEIDKYTDLNPSEFYLEQPFKDDGSLIVSDRRVELNGVITPWKANYVVDSIHYLNNKNSKYPIFIVIENSPGGSVSAGLRILEAMRNSKAPVYVVLKGFAASMAAIITTLASKSFAYPNATIIHHQLSGHIFGGQNVREAREFSKQLEKWNRRLLGPVAKRMGISLEELEKRFYENSVHGDWEEFADDAYKMNWVGTIVRDIKEVSIMKMPNAREYTYLGYVDEYYRYGNAKDSSKKDKKEVDGSLPKLASNDFYYMYDPQNRYKVVDRGSSNGDGRGRESYS